MKPFAVSAPAMVALSSIALGVATVLYVGWVSDSLIRVAALPLVVALLVLLALDKRRLFLLIMLVRAVCDPIFDAAKFSVGGVNIGVGAALNALIILIALLFVIDRPADRTQARPRIPLWAPLILLVLLGAALRSPDPMSAVRTLLVLVSYAAVFAIPYYLARNGDDLRFGIRVVLLSSLLPVLYAFADIAMNWGGGGVDGFRLKSSFSHANIFAFYLVLVISLLLYRFKSATESLPAGKRWLFGAYMVLLLGLLVLTKTRSAWLACCLVFAVYGVFFERRTLLYLAAAPLLALLLPDVRDRLLDLTATNLYDPYAKLNSFEWRLEIWKAGIAWMRPLSLLIGFGLDSFEYYSPQFFALAGNTNFAAHNVYVQWLFETGALGMLCLAWVFYRVLHLIAQRSKIDRTGSAILISLVAAYLIVCASDNVLYYLSFNWYFWFAIGSACAAGLTTQKAAQEAAAHAQSQAPTIASRRRRGMARVAQADKEGK